MFFSKPAQDSLMPPVSGSSFDSIDDAQPAHYSKDASPYNDIKALHGAEGLMIYVTGNILKYVKRYPFKYKGDPDKQLEDLIKARNSLDTMIELHKEINADNFIRLG